MWKSVTCATAAPSPWRARRYAATRISPSPNLRAPNDARCPPWCTASRTPHVASHIAPTLEASAAVKQFANLLTRQQDECGRVVAGRTITLHAPSNWRTSFLLVATLDSRDVGTTRLANTRPYTVRQLSRCCRQGSLPSPLHQEISRNILSPITMQHTASHSGATVSRTDK